MPSTLTTESPIVADAHALYLAFGGRQHRAIEAAMRAKGYERFSRRVFYNRLERGKLSFGWVRRFNWQGTADAPVRTDAASASDHNADNNLFSAVRNDAASASDHDADNNFSSAVRTSHSAFAAPRSALYIPHSKERRRNEIRAFRRWLQRVSPGMTWHWPHLKLLFRKLADVTTGKTKRLMIFMPPRHGKSELVTVHYPAYRLRRDASLNVIVGSYNQRLANRFSRKIRTTWEEAGRKDAESQAGSTAAGTPKLPENGKSAGSEPPAYSIRTSPGSEPPTGVPAAASASGVAMVAGGLADKTSESPPVNSSSPQSGVQPRLNTAAEWETGLGGGVRAVGVGAGITGYGGKLVIIDDPIKSRSEAESETYRDRTWEWFNDDLYTRLEPGASMILIQTRWHEDDLAGRLLEEMKNGGEKWEVVSLPAIAEQIENRELRMENKNHFNERADQVNQSDLNSINNDANASSKKDHVLNLRKVDCSSSGYSTEDSDQIAPPGAKRILHSQFSLLNSVDAIGRLPGDPLCPDRFNLEELSRIRRQLGEYSFAALYQQRPMPLEGGLFKKKWFTRIVDYAPAGLRWFRGYDLAISTKTSADFTASARVALDTNGDLYISDVFRARVEYPEQRRFIIDRLVNERDTEHCIEDAIHAKAVIHDLRREPALARCAIRLVTVTTDKFTRALAWANRAEEGKVVLVRGPWLNMFLDEVCSFPNAAHDDQVDAVSLAVQMTDRRKRQFWRF